MGKACLKCLKEKKDVFVRKKLKHTGKPEFSALSKWQFKVYTESSNFDSAGVKANSQIQQKIMLMSTQTQIL